MLKTEKPQKGSAHDQRVVEGGAESRWDPLTGNWTIFAPNRTDRPDEYESQVDTQTRTIECPFCPGNEDATPDPVWVGRVSDEDSSIDILNPSSALPDKEDWSVRVVPNRFPAVDPVNGSVTRAESPELFRRAPIRGGHEVIIESRGHHQSLTQLDLAELNLAFTAYRDRLKYWRSMPGVAYLSTFKNVGGKAGASLSHTHSQLIATDRIPTAVRASVERMVRHRASTGCCLQCDLIRAEIKSATRMVWRDDTLVAYCPFASQMPMAVRISTIEHQARFEDLNDAKLEAVSRRVQRIVSWLEKIRPGTAYNFCLHTCPPGLSDATDAYHWAIDIFPRMTQLAGFEWSSHCLINPLLPEMAAAKYRVCARAEDPRVRP